MIGFDVGGIPDWLEDRLTGLLVPEQDISGLARAMERMIKSPDLAAQLGRNAVERFKERFDFDRHMDRLEVLLTGHGNGSTPVRGRRQGGKTPAKGPIRPGGGSV